MTSEQREGPTPNGGVRSVIYYQADDGSPAEKEQATACEIIEYDADGEVVNRTYGTLTPRGE